MGQAPWTASSRKAEREWWSPGAHLEPRAPARTCRRLHPFLLQPPAQPAIQSPPGPPPPALHLSPVFLDLTREVFPPTLLLCCPSDTPATNTRMWKRIQESCDCAVELLFSVGGLYQWQEAPVPGSVREDPCPRHVPLSPACLLQGGQAPIAWTCHHSQIALRETLKHTGQSWSGHSWDLH